MGPNIKDIIENDGHILGNCQIIQNEEIMVACKREKNLKDLLTRAYLFNTINIVYDKNKGKKFDLAVL